MSIQFYFFSSVLPISFDDFPKLLSFFQSLFFILVTVFVFPFKIRSKHRWEKSPWSHVAAERKQWSERGEREGFPVCESRCGSPLFTHNKNNPSLRDWTYREIAERYRPQIHFNTFTLTVMMLINKNIKLICFKGTIHPKMNVLLSFIYPHVVPNKYDFLSSMEHNGGLLKYILATLLDFGPFFTESLLYGFKNILNKLFGPFQWFIFHFGS